MKEKTKDHAPFYRLMYILEAAFEYFISLLMIGAYIAKVATTIGLSDSTTGILTSLVSLGLAFQIVAIFLAGKRPVKRWVSLLHITNQLCFSLVYFVPFLEVSKSVRIALFILFLMVGHILNNVVNSPKTKWFMDFVDDKKRGSFTATKEIVSLIGGMLFTFFVSAVIDHFEARDDLYHAFLFCGIGIFVLMLLHTATLLLTKEKETELPPKSSFGSMLGDLLKNKKLLRSILIIALWNVANYVTTPFLGTYQIKELGFSMVFVSLLSVLYSVSRALISKPIGRYGDKTSFLKMFQVCFSFMALAFGLNVFTTPENGQWMFPLYYLLYALGAAGITSGEINLIYECVDHDHRVGALALKSSLSGVLGFVTTLAVSPLVTYVQSNGNRFLGIPLYAQQLLSAITTLILIGLLIYIHRLIKKQENEAANS
ncbi:MAG: MFS transporter [Clostridia bacterium]|nr:MFS transporter [Clostridia bacterium]